MRGFLLLLPIACAWFWGPSASALTIQVFAGNGATGMDGESATAIAAGVDPSNTARAFGGAGGLGTAVIAPGDGGSANATATVAAAADANASAEATGGGGGVSISADAGGTGGGATATASAEGSLSVLATSRAIGGSGGLLSAIGGDGGAAQAEARGTSSDGAPVTVRAFQAGGTGGWGGVGGRGADSQMIDAVSGATSGLLRLEQVVVGGLSGYSDLSGREGGTASGSLSAENTGGGDLDALLQVIGGVGGSSTGGDGGAGGAAQLGSLTGLSTTGRAVTLAAEVFGGRGGDAGGSGRGGDGAGVSLVDRVSGHTSGVLALRQRAVGGDGGDSRGAEASLAGDALSHLEIQASASALRVETEASGGVSGRLMGATGTPSPGGAADARSVASNDSGSATANALARGGVSGGGDFNGSIGGAGGDATAYASARTTGDGHAVLVGDPEPLAPVTGAQGGGPAFGTLLAGGGDAASESWGEAVGDSAVQVFDHASGGNGGEGGAGGSAWSSAVGRNAGSEAVEVFAEARGGAGGGLSAFSAADRGGAGGQARLGTVYGASIDGDVLVIGSAIGGSGGDGAPQSGQPAGAGASVLLENAVDGDTSGSLYLEQRAVGGRAGNYGDGAHGETSSRLDVSKSLEALEITSLAYGALDAQSRVIAENTGGAITVHSEASGGTGRAGDQETAEHGGNARGIAIGESAGDGHAIVVAPRDSFGLSAHGGQGAGAGAAGGTGGEGGYAWSDSHGLALGDSSIFVEDRAIAGDGGFGGGAGGAPGVGGGAFSFATGSSMGLSPVHVTSYAAGGRGGTFDELSNLSTGSVARGGTARAGVEAYGAGEVVAHATAVTGRPRGSFVPLIGVESGPAEAEVSASGASGEARADAHAAGFELRELSAETSASVRSLARIKSSVAVGDSFPRQPFPPFRDFDALALATGRPKPGDVQAATLGHEKVADAFAGDGIDIVLGLGQIGFRGPLEADGAAATRHAALSLVPSALEVSVLQDVVIGFMHPQSLGAGFDSLRFRANLRDETLVDVSFDELDDALAYFDDRVLDLGNFAIAGSFPFFVVSPLELVFDWTGSESGTGFSVDLLVGLTPVPEPSTVLLVALGLVLMAARARRRRIAAI